MITKVKNKVRERRADKPIMLSVAYFPGDTPAEDTCDVKGPWDDSLLFFGMLGFAASVFTEKRVQAMLGSMKKEADEGKGVIVPPFGQH